MADTDVCYFDTVQMYGEIKLPKYDDEKATIYLVYNPEKEVFEVIYYDKGTKKYKDTSGNIKSYEYACNFYNNLIVDHENTIIIWTCDYAGL